MTKRSCYICLLSIGQLDSLGEEVELRPYGVNGQDICFNCMISDSQREEEAKRQLHRGIEVAGDTVLLTEYGPMPIPEKVN